MKIGFEVLLHIVKVTESRLWEVGGECLVDRPGILTFILKFDIYLRSMHSKVGQLSFLKISRKILLHIAKCWVSVNILLNPSLVFSSPNPKKNLLPFRWLRHLLNATPYSSIRIYLGQLYTYEVWSLKFRLSTLESWTTSLRTTPKTHT